MSAATEHPWCQLNLDGDIDVLVLARRLDVVVGEERGLPDDAPWARSEVVSLPNGAWSWRL